MTSKYILAGAITLLLVPVILAQKPADKAPSKVDPPKATAVRSTPARSTPPKNNPPPAPARLAVPAVVPAPADKPADEAKDEPPPSKAKGPTIITSREGTFDQKANVAVFIGDVMVVDPEFNVRCDKLTAHLLQDDKTKPPATLPGKPAQAPAAAPATPPPAAAGADAKPEEAPPKKKAGGLEKAVAEVDPGHRVLITQEKLETDGTITHSVGRADQAVYDAVTGDVTLYGSPEVIQGVQSVIALEPGAIITLNRNGHMSAKGLTKTTISNKDD